MNCFIRKLPTLSPLLTFCLIARLLQLSFENKNNIAGASGIAFRYEGEVWLIDCGEGTQTQLMKLKTIRPGTITKIFITHLHGDHMFGLPGFMCTISMALKSQGDAVDFEDIGGSSKPDLHKTVTIYGPIGLRRFLREALNLSRSVLAYKYVVHELVPLQDQYHALKDGDPDWVTWNPEHCAKGQLHFSELGHGRSIYMDKTTGTWPLFRGDCLTVCAGQLQHRIPSFGYVITEDAKPGKLNSEKLVQFGVPKGPLFGRIKNGESVVLDDGRTVNPSDFIGSPQPGRKVAVLQDTRDSSCMEEACRNCDVLVHEATLENSCHVRCVQNGHSTPQMAAEFASKTESEMLVMTHFSQRYKHAMTHEVKEGDPTTDILESEAATRFNGPIIAAYDGLVVNVKRKSVGT